LESIVKLRLCASITPLGVMGPFMEQLQDDLNKSISRVNNLGR